MKTQLLLPYKHTKNPHSIYLLHKCLAILDSFELERHVFADQLTHDEGKLFTHYRFQIHEGYNRGEWRTVKEAYDLLEGPYIAICHADDYWIQGKLDAQLKYITTNAIVTTSYLLNKDHFEQVEYCLRRCVLHHDVNYGLVDCMPSTWLLNKEKLPTLPVPFFARYCTDLAVLMAIAQQYPIVVLNYPFVFYNEHTNNQGNSIPKTEVEAGRNQLKSYVKTCQRPVLKYYWD